MRSERATDRHSVRSRAMSAVRLSLRHMGLPAQVVARRDELGYRIDVLSRPDHLPRFEEWRLAFGRSWGPVRIFVGPDSPIDDSAA